MRMLTIRALGVRKKSRPQEVVGREATKSREAATKGSLKPPQRHQDTDRTGYV
ncbi:hypothetical protein GF359_05185 [candidate division WOR-3 bacterium]|uniref:Uncharacterized protein n=1 Tax=candidate division WOR-3 bacterium TaxID=2052148 RepID=A0A9D5QE08_UNCW3|nr:hypothetical protein [candidate division WOR-3 bacterium]MBD3364590.1 hypothetical protein [candidate division WOR-3 bacterium]